jgi:AcrR family transcriptional regulator
MHPRPYQLGRRQEAADQTRARILGAARELLAAPEGYAGFTIDAVAREAGVARMTVYYQFSSKVGLLEALSDDLATRGHMDRMGRVFSHADPRDAIAELVAIFAGLWSADRSAMRRLRGLGTLDPEVGQVVHARDERRRHIAGVLVGRVAERYGRPVPAEIDAMRDLLFTLTSFETFDSLAGADRTPEDVIPVVTRLALIALGFDPPHRSSSLPSAL